MKDEFLPRRREGHKDFLVLREVKIIFAVKSFRDDAVNTLADKTNVHNLHIAHVRFGGDVTLEPRTERTTQEVAEESEGQREGDEQEPPTGGFGASKRDPGKGRGKNRRDDEVGAAAGMYGESAFAGAEPGQRLLRRRLDFIGFESAEQEKAGRVGMSRHGLILVCARQHVKRGVFERVVSSCFENEGKFEEHVTIIHAMQDDRHVPSGGSLENLIEIYANPYCSFDRIGENVRWKNPNSIASVSRVKSESQNRQIAYPERLVLVRKDRPRIVDRDGNLHGGSDPVRRGRPARHRPFLKHVERDGVPPRKAHHPNPNLEDPSL